MIRSMGGVIVPDVAKKDTIAGLVKMTYRNKSYEVGDLVQAVWVDENNEPSLTGVILSIQTTQMGQKVKVLWNEIGIRTEWINDIRRIN